MATIDAVATLDVITCGECGIPFAVPEWWLRRRRESHETFYCPNGHARAFRGQSEAEQLRDQLAREKHWREQADARAAQLRGERDAAERRVTARKGVITRMKRRAVKGMCPCCSKKFKDLAIHMREQHPAFDPEKHVAAIEAKPDA